MFVSRPHPISAAIRLFGAMSVAVALLGCGASNPQAATDGLGEGRYALKGTVVSVSPERGTLLVDHDEIPGYMPAMTMEFAVAAGDLANARPGQRIRGVLYQTSEAFHLEQIWPLDEGGQRIVHATQHVHGGIGVDTDYPQHRYFRWAKDLELQLGGANRSLVDLGAELARVPAGMAD